MTLLQKMYHIETDKRLFNDLYVVEKLYDKETLSMKLIVQDNTDRGYRVFDSLQEFWDYNEIVPERSRQLLLSGMLEEICNGYGDSTNVPKSLKNISLSRYLRTSVDIHRNDLFVNKSLVIDCVDNLGLALDNNANIDPVPSIPSQSDTSDQKEFPKELYNETHNCDIQSDVETKNSFGFRETGF
ncbi:hypothetical protein GLOIN_2v1486654 [Rhizophagus clarus]|uniref:Uncharacterized protein n=1 Tax=Rhizophagus clarus TaxID=94130 RepID=A0A8H3QXJ5_9GLOM|nr:hypothetical protein GLOIN_2v1486654 [Rhizophagus clarus]